MPQTQNLTDILSTMTPGDGEDRVSVKEIFKALENRGFGALLLGPALIAFLPTGGIPGVPTLCGLCISFIAVQYLFGKDRPWIPRILREREINAGKFTRLLNKGKRVSRKVDRFIKPRLPRLFQPGVKKLTALLCVALGLSMIPLELLPFAVMIPALSIILLSVSIVARDGIMLVIAYTTVAIGGAGLALYFQ